MTGPGRGADRVVAIDVGTQSVRAMVVGPDGAIDAVVRVPIVPYVSPRPGWAEQDPEVHWAAVGEACRRVLADPRVRRDALAGATLTTQRGTVVVTDAAGQALRPAMIWLDDRRTDGLPPFGGVGGVTALGFRALGLRDTIETFAAACEANWIRLHEPDTWRRIARYLLLSGFLTQRLTGRFVDSSAAQVGYLPFDYRRFRWAAPGDWRWTVAPVLPEWLPELVAPTALADAHSVSEHHESACRCSDVPFGWVGRAGGNDSCLSRCRSAQIFRRDVHRLADTLVRQLCPVIRGLDRVFRWSLKQAVALLIAWCECGTQVVDRCTFRCHLRGSALGTPGSGRQLFRLDAWQVALDQISGHGDFPFVCSSHDVALA